MAQITLAVMLAVTVEALVEYGKSILALATAGGWKSVIVQLAAATVAVGLCLTADADLFAAIGMPLGTVGGRVLTGILIARGSNYLADFLTRLTAAEQGK